MMVVSSGKADSEIAVYETLDVESSSEDETSVEPVNEAIITSAVTRDAALELLADRPRRTDETVSTRVARIRREIEELRRSGAEIEAADLLSELKSQIKPRNPATAAPPEDTDIKAPANPAAQREFVELESRIADLEARLGVSVRSGTAPKPLAKSINELRQTVELLASSPENVSSLVTKLKEVSSVKTAPTKQDRIDVLYSRLSGLEEAIEALPQVLSRLQTLRFVHAEAVNQQEQLNDTQATLESMRKDIANWRAVLETLEGRVTEYIATSQENIKALLQH